MLPSIESLKLSERKAKSEQNSQCKTDKNFQKVPQSESENLNMNSKFVIFVFAILCASVVVFGLPTPDEDPEEHVATRASCVLPMETGVCRARMSRWGYVPSQKQCVSFFYGGCLGNANNFHTKEDCMQICEGV